MKHLNIEIKARCDDLDKIRDVLKAHKAEFKGTDHQIDTYFKIHNGRLKLREGNIENALIYYKRPDQSGPKQSDVLIYPHDPCSQLRNILGASLSILATVDKEREIYFIENVKFHIDKVKGLGSFVEIEAIDSTNTIGRERLLKQCNHYLGLFEITEESLVSESYSDLLIRREAPISSSVTARLFE